MTNVFLPVQHLFDNEQELAPFQEAVERHIWHAAFHEQFWRHKWRPVKSSLGAFHATSRPERVPCQNVFTLQIFSFQPTTEDRNHLLQAFWGLIEDAFEMLEANFVTPDIAHFYVAESRI